MCARKSSSKPPARREFRWWQWLALGGWLLFFTGLLLAWQFTSSYRTLLAQAGLSDNDLLTLLHTAQLTTPQGEDGVTNVLVLGTDSLEYRDAAWPLTDTIIIASLQPASGAIRLLSLPRDTVLPGTGGRINAIYPQFYAQATESARERTAATLSDILDIPIHYSVVVTMGDVRDFLDLIGGVNVDVQTAFVDYQYPRDDVDIRVVHDPALLYETVEFATGPTHLDGTTALKFMRSRHAQSSEGSDFARSARQQQVIAAVTTKIATLVQQQLGRYDLTLVGQFYRFYQEKYDAQIPFVDGLALGLAYLRQGELPTIYQEALSVDTPGSFLHENPRDYTLQVSDLAGLRGEIQAKLGLDKSDKL